MSDQVLFRLKLEPDQDAPAVLSDFVSATKEADREIVASAQSRSRQVATTFKESVAEQTKSAAAMSETFSRSSKEVNDKLLETGKGLLQFGRGMAELGIASEDTLESMVKGILRLQGGLDVVEGVVKTFRNMQSAIELASAASAASAAKTKIAAASNVVAINGEIAAWERLIVVKTASGAAIPGGAGLRGGAVAAGGAATGGAAASGMFSGLSFSAVGAAVLGALGVGFGTAVGIESIDRLGGLPGDDRERGIAGLVSARREAAASTQEAENARQRRLAQLATTTRTELRAGAEARLLFRGGQAREAALDERIGLANPADQARLLKEAFSEAMKARDAASTLSASDVPKATRAAAADEAGRLTERLKDLAQQRLVTEQKILDAAKRTSEERKRAAEDELRLVKDRVKVEEDRLKTAAERFGGLSEREQAAARAAITQARRFGADTLDRDQASILASIGTSAARAAAEASNLRRARDAGFDRYFGEDEREAIRRGRADALGLELQIRTEQHIQAKLELDESAIVKQTAAAVVKLAQEQEARLSKKIEDEVRRLKREINSRTRDQLIGAAATLGGT